MDVVVLTSQNGGAGKTTLAGHLAVAAGMESAAPVILPDTDPQGSLSPWWNRRQDNTPLLSSLPHLRDLPARLEELRRSGVALAVIDTPPAISSAIREVMRVPDLVVMPVRPSPHNHLDAIGGTNDLAQQAHARFVFVVTQARVTPQAVALLSAHGTVASSIIQDRVINATAMTDGRTALDASPKGAAAPEILALWTFIQGRLRDGTKEAKNDRSKYMPKSKPADLAPHPIGTKGSVEGPSPPVVNSEPMTFKVSTEVRKRFKRYAFEHDMRLNQVLVRALEALEEKDTA